MFFNWLSNSITQLAWYDPGLSDFRQYRQNAFEYQH